jgi:hypothetical protein
MKYFILFFILFPNYLFSQTNNKTDDIGRITLNVLLPDDSKIPEETKDYFTNKLKQITSNNGLGGTDNSNPRFILSGNIIEVNKEQISESLLFYFNLEIILYVIDLQENKIFNSLSLNLKGLGDTKLKAYVDCIKRLEPQNKQIKEFLENGKTKIINYYTTQCDYIQANAKNLAKQNKFDEALYNLSLVPNVSESCYNVTLSNMIEIYNSKINYECRQSIDKAKLNLSFNRFDEVIPLVTMISPKSDCYKESQSLLKELYEKKCAFNLNKARVAFASNKLEEVESYLSEIPSDAKCISESNKLIEEVKKLSKERDKREWDFKLNVSQDDAELRKFTINAIKEIGISYGKSQPKTIVYNNFKTFW